MANPDQISFQYTVVSFQYVEIGLPLFREKYLGLWFKILFCFIV